MVGDQPQSREPSIPALSRIAIACLALPPALIAVLQLGRLHPDEIYQALEPAHYLAFGKGWLSWEWEHGLRNWAVPGFLSGLLQLCRALGVDDPQARRAVIELPQYALHALSLVAVYRLVKRRAPEVGHEAWWLAGVALIALYAPVLHYAGRTLSESISTSFMLWGLERADARGLRLRTYVIAGALLGLAVVARYGSAVVALTALLYLAASRRGRDALYVALGGAIVAGLLGLLDALTWGEPFHSLRAYLDYNVLSDEAAKVYGREPVSFYVWWLLKAPPLWFWPASVLAGLSLRTRSAHACGSGLLYACALAYLVAIFCTAHKEERFLYPALVLLLAAALPAWIGALAKASRAAGPLVLVLSLASGLVLLAVPGTRFLPRATEQFRLFVEGVRTGTGVVITKSGKWGAPGYFYAAGRPWRLCEAPNDACTRGTLKSKKYNRVVAFRMEGQRELQKRGFDVLDTEGNYTLWGR